jgi:MFS family permease
MSTTIGLSHDVAPPAPDTNPAASEFPPAREGWFAVSVLALTTTFALLDQGILGLLIQQIKTDFALTDTQAGWLLGPAFVIFYAVLGLPLSRFIDRGNRTLIISIGIFVWSIATAACGLAVNFVQLFLARIMVGAGEAVNGPAAYSIVSDYFPRDKLPRAVATLQIGSAAGGGLSLLLGGLMITIVAVIGTPNLPVIGVMRPWQVVFMAVGLPGVLVALLLRLVKEPPRHGLRAIREKVGFGQAMRYLWLHFALFGPMFIGLTLGSLDTGGKAWGAAFFQRTYGWMPGRYGLTSGVVSLALMLAGLYLGTKSVEWIRKQGKVDGAFRVILYARLVNIPFAILMPLMPNPYLALACSGVGFLTLGMSGPMLNVVMLTVTPNRIRGQVAALYLFIFTVVGQGLAPLLTGIVTDYVFTSPDDLRWSILLLHIVFLPAALAITWLGWRPYREEVERLNRDDPQGA